MSQQPDNDDGTVIRPAAMPPSVSLPLQMGEGSPFDTADDGLSLRMGTRLGEFEITGRLGAGGFSIVYLAMDHSLERTVALKEYMPSSLAARIGVTQVQPRSQRFRETFDAGLKSFVNEAKLLAQFDHPSLVKVYRFWEANGTAYMVMPFYRGVTLKDAVRAMPEPPDEAWLLTLLAPLTEALMVIHADRCYHRDIAPDNVILLEGTSKPLLLDFGAARRVIGDMTHVLTVILKAGYAPLEQYAEVPGARQGPWTDVYALAAVVYWVITGSTPPASVGRMMSDSYVPLTRCAAGRYSMRFLQAIDRALVLRPEQRTQTIEALRHDIGLTGARPASPLSPPQSNDPDATVIRPIGYRAKPATDSPREVPDVSVGPAQTGLPTRATPLGPQRATEAQQIDKAVPRREAPPHDAATRQVRADGGATKTRPRRIVPVVFAVAAAVASAGIWWAVQNRGVESPGPVPKDERAIAPDPPPTVTNPPAVPVPASEAPPASRETTANVPPSADTEALRPTPPVAPPSPVELAPDTQPPRPAKKVTPAATASAQREQSPKRPSQRSETEAIEPAQADYPNRDECARIFQRLSLGDTNPELLRRVKTLNCR